MHYHMDREERGDALFWLRDKRWLAIEQHSLENLAGV